MRNLLPLMLVLVLALSLVGCDEEETAAGSGRAETILETARAAFDEGDLDGAEAGFRLAAALTSDEDNAAAAREGVDEVIAERWYLEAYNMLNQLQLIEPPPPAYGSPQTMEELFQQLQLNFAQVNYQVSVYPLLRSAVRAVNSGLDAEPEHPGLNYILALLYTQTGDPNLALRQLKHLHEVAPEHWGYQRGLAYLYQAAGEREKALEAAEQALELAVEPDDRMLAFDLLVELSLDDPDPKLVDGYAAQAAEEFGEYGDGEALAVKIEVARTAREGRQPDYGKLLERSTAALEKPFVSEFSRESFVYSTASMYAQSQRFSEAVELLENHVAEGGDFTITMQQLIQQINMLRDPAELEPDFSIIESVEQPEPQSDDQSDDQAADEAEGAEEGADAAEPAVEETAQ